METIASLIREFPFGSFLIITAIIAGIIKIAITFINRNKPECNCEEDCECEDEDDEPEGDRVIMGGEEEDED
jgi:hypothetical protein